MFRWAEGHLERTRDAEGAFMDTEPYTLIADDHDGFREKRVRVSVSPSILVPDDIVFWAGDTLHNLRVALDYLAFRIVRRQNPSVDEDKIAFPIYRKTPKDIRKPQEFWGLARNTLPGVNADTLHAFEALQPYH